MNHQRRFVGVLVVLLGAALSATGLGAPAADPHAKTAVPQDQKPPPLSPPPKGSVLARRVKEVKVDSVLVMGQGIFWETQLHVIVAVAGKRLLSLDPWKSKVVSFHDDNDTDFTVGDSS